jgi:putative membrane-bound dehydrogenase-like protein
MILRILTALVVVALAAGNAVAEEPKPLKILFLGDEGHHRPAERFRQLQPVLAKRGIDMTYTDKVTALNPELLSKYDGLVVYANTTRITPEQEKALLDFVAGGKGFIPLHCASYCFLNSPKYIELVGAQFQRHDTGTFRTTIAEATHPIMKGFGGFESWDETYVHTKHNEKDRTVLEYRAEGDRKEPWTWVRTHGKGRVFYTAWGHDERTWSNPGFQNLVERGIRWACGGDPSVVPSFHDKPEMTTLRKDAKPFEYVDANVPFYPPSPRWGVTADPLKKMQKPLSPEESMKHYVHPTDFEMKLFVDETHLGGKPICMNWDERGRLWVALTVDYPNNMQPEGKGNDKIVICEDTDGDGVADKFTVFADKLSLPTSMCFSNGGVIVTQPPHTLFLKSSKGDDKADIRKILFTGWGIGDTHAGPSNLRYGFDNWIYGICGYSGFNGDVGGVRHRFGQGFYRFKPDGSQLEFLRSTNNNSWGVGFSEEGLLFGSTANGCPSVYMPIPNRYYESVRGWSSSQLQSIASSNKFYPITDKVRQVDWHGGFTAAAGHALYTARTYPKEYWNRTAFVSDPTGHLTATFELLPNGTDFRSRYGWNLVAADDEWASPIMAEVGPDGNVWVIDWYAYIVQHNPTPPGWKTGKGAAYETELRDKTHGRIYRLMCKNAKPAEKITLKDATPDKLVATLKSDNMFWRLHAQRLLVESGRLAKAASLYQLVSRCSSDAHELDLGAVHGLWAMQGLGLVGNEKGSGEDFGLRLALNCLTNSKSAAVRRNAALVLPETKGLPAVQRAAVMDSDPQVRLAALLKLSELPEDEETSIALVSLLKKSEDMADRWIPDAITIAGAKHAPGFLKGSGRSKESYSLRALDILSRIAEHYARGSPTESVGSLLIALRDAEGKQAEAILAGIAKGWPKDKLAKLDSEAEKAMVGMFSHQSTAGKGQLVRLATMWGSKAFEKQAVEISKTLTATVADEKQSDTDRIAAAKQLVEFRAADGETVIKLLDTLNPRTPPQIACGFLDALGASTSDKVGPAVLERLETWPPSVRLAAVRLLLSRPESTRALLDGLEKGQIQLGELALDQKQALSVHPNPRIANRARRILDRGGALPNPDRQKVIDSLLSVTTKTGDATAGKAVFKKHCATCHMHSGEGNKIGPDLSGVAVHPKEHLIVDILDPSRSVEGNFRVYQIVKKDGGTLSGLLASESKTAVEVIDAEAKKHVLQRDDIEVLSASNKSLMPEGFEKQMSAEELTNLLEFLTQRGRYLPLPIDKAATIVSTRGMFFADEGLAERLIFKDWSPKTFDGVPFLLVDPREGKQPNVILLYGPHGTKPPKMPKSARVPCNTSAKAIHLLSGVSGWGFPASSKGTVSMIVRLHYADGKLEDHELKNGEHFADYIRRVDVPGSKFAFALRGQQIRYLTVEPKRPEKIKEIEFVKGPDDTAPIVMAVTVEGEK